MIGPKVTGVPNGVGDSVVLDFLMLTLVGQVERGGLSRQQIWEEVASDQRSLRME